jgi:hypothetical protein
LPEALGFLESLLGSPQLHLLSESPGYFEKPATSHWQRA